jgi:hypothetical protein
MTLRQSLVSFVLLAGILGGVAAAAPKPWFLTDEDIFEDTAQRFIAPDCSDLQCFRLLGSWIVGRLPGAKAFRWKTYAVVATAGAALVLGRFCLAMGLDARASRYAMWLVAFGFGPLLTLYNPYSPDPLIYLAGPLLMTELVRGRRMLATVLAAIGVFAKEAAAAPLWVFFAWSLLRRQWDGAVRAFAMAFGVTLVWVWLQLWLIVVFNYSYSGSKSTDLLHGGDLVVWWGEMGLRGGLSAIFGAFGGLFFLMPAGFARASRDLRLMAIAALPAVLVLCYVQQPDRALWTFHYLMIPFAALALRELSDGWCWLFIACYALANMRIGANLQFITAARYMLLLSVLIAGAAVVQNVRRLRTGAVAGQAV